MTRPIQLDKTYGVLHTENYFSFLGFAKKIGSHQTQKIDVFLDDKLIDTIEANEFIQKIDDMYDVESKAFTYNLPVQYIGKKAIISFKNHDSGEELLNSPYTLIDKNHEDFNEAKFLHSLSEPLSEELKNMYKPNCVGFLATKENMEDEEFIGYIKELMERFPDIEFKAFMIKGKDKNKDISSLMKKLKIIYISNISDIIFNSMLYIHNGSNISKANILIKLIGNMPFIYYSKDDFIMSLEQNELKYENEILQAYGIDITEKSFYKDYLGFISSSISKKMLRKDFSFCYIDAALNSLEIRNKLIEMKL